MNRTTAEQITDAALVAAGAIVTAELTPEKFADDIEKAIKKIFPRSLVKAKYSEGITRSITVWFALQGNKSKHSSGIVQNDPAYQIIHVWFGTGKPRAPGDRDDSRPEKFSVENGSGWLTVKPEPGSHLAFDRVKLGWRKKTGDAATILKHLVSYFTRAKKIVRHNFDRLPDSFQSKGLGLE